MNNVKAHGNLTTQQLHLPTTLAAHSDKQLLAKITEKKTEDRHREAGATAKDHKLFKVETETDCC